MTEQTLTILRRRIPSERTEQLERMSDLLEANGFYANPVQIDAAWSAACLSRPQRPAWMTVKAISDDIVVMWLMTELEEQPEAEDEIEVEMEEPDNAEARAEQDDGGPSEGEGGGEPAEVEEPPVARNPGKVETPAKRRGRPPGKRKVDSF